MCLSFFIVFIVFKVFFLVFVEAFFDLRSKEHQLRLSGATYEEIAESGGGIVSSVKSVREATEKQLYSKSLPRIDRFLSLGTTTIEAKSGYCLEIDSE